MFWTAVMRILVREPQFCSRLAGWHFCWESLDENHNLRPWMQKWWESPYENQNFGNWKNKTFRHSGRPKWNPPDTERSLKTRIAKKEVKPRTHREKLLSKFHPNVLSFFVDPPDTERSLTKWILQEALFSDLPASEAREQGPILGPTPFSER